MLFRSLETSSELILSRSALARDFLSSGEDNTPDDVQNENDCINPLQESWKRYVNSRQDQLQPQSQPPPLQHNQTRHNEQNQDEELAESMTFIGAGRRELNNTEDVQYLRLVRRYV